MFNVNYYMFNVNYSLFVQHIMDKSQLRLISLFGYPVFTIDTLHKFLTKSLNNLNY